MRIETAAAFEPLLKPARYKGAHGGRGSGKSHFFAGLLVEDALAYPGDAGEGLRAVCIREIQKDLRDSAKRLIETKIHALGLGEADGFRVQEKMIRLPGDGLVIFNGMTDHTAESVKSLEGFHRAWIEEAHTLSGRSLDLLRPTIRAPGSQIWASWNPRRKADPIDQALRSDPLPTGAVVVQANWRDNPWFTAELDAERLDCLRDNPDHYRHIWEGEYAQIVEGAYYAKHLTAMRAESRLGRVSRDPLMTVRAFFDIGGTGAKADATAIWIAQFVGREIRVLDYCEGRGQELAFYVNWLRDRGYAKCMCVLPHDGKRNDYVYDVSYQSALDAAGFDTLVIPNQGTGAAAARIEAARRLFPRIWVNEETTRGGVEALGAYHARKDEKRLIDLGPEHDWSSHAADAWGLMCVAYEEQQPAAPVAESNYSWVV